jgi:CBS domain-containing protein
MARVGDIMLTHVSTLKKEAKITDAAKILADYDIDCVVVIENDAPVGILTEFDFVKNVISRGISVKKPVTEIMSYPVTTMNPKMKLDTALKVIDTKKYKRYPVVHNGKLIGLAVKHDIINKISDNVKFHRELQNMVLIIFVLFEIFIFLFYGKVYSMFL